MPIPSSFALIVVAVLGGLVALSGLAFLIFRTQISNLIGTAYKASARRIAVEGSLLHHRHSAQGEGSSHSWG